MKKKMNSKMLVILMTLAMAFTMMPVMGETAHAEDAVKYYLYVSGTQVTGANMENVLGDGKVKFTPAKDGGKARLTLDNAEIDVAYIDDRDAAGIYMGYGTYGEYVGDLDIVLKGENRIIISDSEIKSGNINGIFAQGKPKGDTKLSVLKEGEGSILKMEMSAAGDKPVRGIKCNDIDTLYVGSDLSMDLSSGKKGVPTCGICASKNLHISAKKVYVDISAPDARGILYEGAMYLDSALTVDLNKGKTDNNSTGIQGHGSTKLDIHGGPVKMRSGESGERNMNYGIASTTVNLYKGSLIIDMGAAGNQSYGLYNLKGDSQYGLNERDNYLNNGGYIEITGHSGAIDSGINVDPDLYEKGVLVNKDPTKEGADSWDKTTSMASYKYLRIPEKTYKLTMHWSSIEGVDIAGRKPIVIEDIPAGMTIKDALAEEGMSLDGEIFKEDGYIQSGAMYVPLTKKSWDDVFGGGGKDRVKEDDTLKFDTDIYFPMWKEIKSASVTVQAPVCGDKTDTQKDPDDPDEWDILSQTNPPKYSFPAGADYGEFVLEEKVPLPKSFWGSYVEDEIVPFTGKFEGGKRYDYGLTMMPKFGCVFSKNISVTVNGNEPKAMESEAGIIIAVFSDIQVEHAWDEGKVTKAATAAAAGVKEYTCKGCGATKTEDIPKQAKKANPLKIKGRTAAVKYKKLNKKAQKISRAKAITVTGPQGALTYKKVSLTYTKAKSVKMSKKALKKYRQKAAKKITINARSGRVTVKKGLKKGTYRVKVKVMAAGNENYDPSAWKTATVRIRIK